MSNLHPHRLLITSVWESQYSPIVDVRWLCNFQGAHLPGRLLPQSFEMAAALAHVSSWNRDIGRQAEQTRHESPMRGGSFFTRVTTRLDMSYLADQ
jgi:hypothetical protein